MLTAPELVKIYELKKICEKLGVNLPALNQLEAARKNNYLPSFRRIHSNIREFVDEQLKTEK